MERLRPGRKDLAAVSAARKTLDLYWQRQRRRRACPARLQVAHAFLGLRLECAQCHRHPHDVWQQDDLLSFANFFMRVRTVGFHGDNEKKFPEVAASSRDDDEAKTLTDQAKKMTRRDDKKLDAEAKTAKTEADRISQEIAKLEKEGEARPGEGRAELQTSRWSSTQAMAEASSRS